MAKTPKSTPAVTATLNLVMLAAIVAAGPNGLLVPLADAAPMSAAGYVELNPNGPDANGQIAARATEAGAKFSAEQTGAGDGTGTATQTVETPKPAFAIDSDVEMPAGVKRGGGRGNNVYPFDMLEVGQSFFVPNTDERPNAAKSMASTVGSANARYMVPDPSGATVTKDGKTEPKMIPTRRFRVLAVDETEKGRSKGARIWRVALDAA